ncbi:hypothetical protein FP568_19320 [Pandoraea pnomenusa]|uniref:hypothetical protein n=1 Tax=Pandoraea pnomenusa TaxID=93220 RepID=UPI0011987350|nr:hypothetical protein [Pandoraea pnomenusa]QDX23165.1 hypothetical protein FP568_19320 [Pandoraea pnomenusa]
MTIENHVHQRLQGLGIDCVIVGDEIHVRRDTNPVKIKFDDEWRAAYTHYKRARSLSFEVDKRQLLLNNSVEILVTRLSPLSALSTDTYTLSDQHGNSVTVGPATESYSLSFFDSIEYEKYFNFRVKKRLLESSVRIRRFNSLLWSPTTAVYTNKGRKTPPDLIEKGISAIRKSLFKIAVEQHDCIAVWKQRRLRIKSLHGGEPTQDFTIPRATYDEDVVSYYKVAKASPFPSQSFLSYYHVLEYYFLRISELLLHDRLTAMLNSPSFRADRDGLDRVISTVRGQDARSDETEMLRSVLDRFIRESDLIEFIQKFEEDIPEKLYTKKRQVFGDQIQISPIKDHAIANTAKVLKHIRNAIVHSSDRYKRDDRHIPLSESEDVIAEFIPIIRFVAEKVIFGTAT